MNTKIATTLVILCTLFVGFPANAQSGLRLNAKPENPQPNQTVSFSLKGDISDRASISWSVDGIATSEGENSTSFRTSAPEFGDTKRVTAHVTTPQEGTESVSHTIRPQAVDIIWQANTYTPPWYQGKALYTRGSTVTFTAIPHITRSNGSVISPSSLFYTWKRDGNVLTTGQGTGKDTITIPLSQGGSNTISVVVEAEGYQGEGRIDIEAESPELVLYEQSPLSGTLFGRALVDTFNFLETETTFIAIPYFFSTTLANNSFMNYTWRLNNEALANSNNRETFRNEGGITGTAHINVRADHTEQRIQDAQTDILINF